jgi:hypothetical protein
VSCASAGNCSAAGDYIDSSGHTRGLLLTATTGVWAPGVEATLPANATTGASVNLGSVSCAAAGDCTAVGYYFDSSGGQQGLLLTETNGVWAPGVEATLPANAVPALSGVRVSPKTFVLAGRRADGRCVKQTRDNHTHQRCTRPIKLTVRYTLNSQATVTFNVLRVAPGRRVNGQCVKPTNTNNRHRRCTRSMHVLPGKITVRGAAGTNRFTFRGRIGGKRLAPRTYRLIATPQANGQAGTSQMIAFKIAG